MTIRDEIVQTLIQEVVGPAANPNYVDSETGQEILLSRVHGTPKSRYGAGMLYPQQSANLEFDSSDNSSGSEGVPTENDDSIFDEKNRNTSSTETGGNDEEPVGLANQYLPSAMGFTTRFSLKNENLKILIKIESAHYIKGAAQKTVKKISSDGTIETVKTKDGELMSDYWIRKPFQIEPIEFDIEKFLSEKKVYDKALTKYESDKDWLKLQVYNRSTTDDNIEGYATLTFVIINCLSASTDDALSNYQILFQNKLSISTTNLSLIVPYRERVASTDTEEERELNLLYRKKRIFAIGHGCSAHWNTSSVSDSESVSEIETAIIPIYDMPQVAPTSHIELSMLNLSDKGDWTTALSSLKLMAEEYEKWIESLEASLVRLEPKYTDAARINISKCKLSLNRIKAGIKLLSSGEITSPIVESFRWMNRAMLWQQQRSKVKLRKWVKIKTDNSTRYDLERINSRTESFESLEDFHSMSSYNGRWRPFQVAFILMNLNSIVNPDNAEREVVDLIWFPTGGGKTEAYLGLTAFTIFYRRLKGRAKFNWHLYGGTSVLMRYTLRLLTTQQYERAASLICACDLIRKDFPTKLGDEPIAIGLWVGGTSTPNEHDKARTQFNLLMKSKFEPYNFIVMKCPCCGAQIGKLENVAKDDSVKIKGLKKQDGKAGKIVFECENANCEYFNTSLPLNVVDEYIYENPPALLIGTVDKFAMLPWKKEYENESKVDASCIFGFRQQRDNSWRRISPPELIIQDELHLISGPLGTMVGLYETMVQTLCNDYKRYEPPFLPEEKTDFVPPKIVASSATISRAYEQVKSLYGIHDRSKLHIFPSQGIEFGNTWFSVEKSVNELDEKGKARYPGRTYVGLLTSGYPSAQTSIVRSYSSVLQKVKDLETSENVGFYWTLLGYFNSIRELGGASSLVFGDIRERLSQIQNRDLVPFERRRKLYDWKIQELTSRINSSEIPEVLKKLEEEHSLSNNKAIDICLATNMVATGVDISRLGLMFIHGQPKTTAEYIQASSRVGRKLPEGAGLVFTLFSPSKPRDKSQYEQFQGYHSRIYSNVEPTSVTPFSINARERALHAIFIGLIRHFSSGSLRENARTDVPEFASLCSAIKRIILERCAIVDSEELNSTSVSLNRIVDFWLSKGVQHYGDAGNYRILKSTGYFPLMYANSSEVREEIIIEKRSLPTPTSMRGVDTESVINVYSNS